MKPRGAIVARVLLSACAALAPAAAFAEAAAQRVLLAPGASPEAAEKLRARLRVTKRDVLSSRGLERWAPGVPAEEATRTLAASTVVAAFDDAPPDPRELTQALRDTEVPQEVRERARAIGIRYAKRTGYFRLPPPAIARLVLEHGLDRVPDLASGRSFHWRLLPDLAVAATTARLGTDGERGWAGWSGDVAPAGRGYRPGTFDSGSGVAWLEGRSLFGRFQAGTQVVVVRPLGAGFHVAVELDGSSVPPDEVEQAEECVMPPSLPSPPNNTACVTGAASTATAITVGVVLSAGAAATLPRTDDVPYGEPTFDPYSGRGHFTRYLVWLANQSLEISRSPMRVRRAGPFDGGRIEQYYSDMIPLLAALRGASGTIAQAIVNWRDTAKADLVIVLTDLGNAGGNPVAGVSPGLCHALVKRDAFAVVNVWDADANLSFLHEMGHLFGAAHDPAANPTPRFAWGRGFRRGCSWRTIMAYPDEDCAGDFPRLLLWSNCTTTYNGVVPGRNSQNNARVLTEQAGTVNGFYP